MASKVISFRFSDTEVEALQKLQVAEDDSINQTAARLLRGVLAGIVEPATIPSTPSSTPVDIKELVKQEVEASLAEVRSQMEELRGKIESPVVEDSATGQHNNEDLMLTRDRVLAKLKMGKQSAVGKAIEAFIKELSTSKPL